MPTIIRIEQVCKSFLRNNQETSVLKGIDLEIDQGSFVVSVGPSGCGKSTLLNIVAGLQPVTSGKVYYKDSPVAGPRLEVGYLTQKDTLMPWRSVAHNVEMPLEIRGGRSAAGGQKNLSRLSDLRDLRNTIRMNYQEECSAGHAWRVCSAPLPKHCSWMNLSERWMHNCAWNYKTFC